MKRKKKTLSLNRENIRLLDIRAGAGRRSFQLSRCYCSDTEKPGLMVALLGGKKPAEKARGQKQPDYNKEVAKRAGVKNYDAFKELVKLVIDED